MNRYFKREAESDLGSGCIWLEFDGELPTRQVERYGDRWFSSREEFHTEVGPGLIDQPLSVLGLGARFEIGPDEFERAWRAAATHE